MSLVLGYANKSNAIIMSDGRAGGTVSPSESYDKTRKVNENIIMGLVGYRESGEHFIKCVYQELGDRIEKCFIDEFLEAVGYGMDLKSTKEHLGATFMIIGRTEDGRIVTSLSGKSTHYIIERNDVSNARLLCIGGIIDGNIIGNIYKENLCNKNISIEDCMKKTIIDISKLDNSINDNIFVRKI